MARALVYGMSVGANTLDFCGGYCGERLGGTPILILIDALTKQANKYWHLSNLMTNEPAISLARTLGGSDFCRKRVLFQFGR